MKIIIEETVTEVRNGELDTEKHPSSAFSVILLNGDKRSILFSNDQYDGFYSRIDGTREEYLGEAQKKAREFSDIMGCEMDVDVDSVADRIRQLKDRIAADQAELNTLLTNRRAK